MRRPARGTAVAAIAVLATVGALGAVAPATAGKPAPGPIVLSPQGNDLDAYTATPPFRSQTVVTHRDADPKGFDINGQVCFLDRHRFVAGEDTNQPNPPAGWGVFRLRGNTVGTLSATRLGRLVPTYQPTDEGPDTYGCGVLRDGRVVTTVIGNNASGPEDGELVIWYPPFDSVRGAKFCILDTTIGTAMGIALDDQDRVYVASARGATAGVLRYTGPFPTAPTAVGGCGGQDAAGSPQADVVHREQFIASGQGNPLVSPNGVARTKAGGFYVSSIFNGIIAEFDATGAYVRPILEPPAGESLGAEPYSTGTPLGLALGPDGTLFYADLGLVIDGTDIGPGDATGTVRRIRFRAGQPQPPETMADGLTFPDGLGIYVPRSR
jgi:hypothetical protein